MQSLEELSRGRHFERGIIQRGVKSRIGTVVDFKVFKRAAVAIAGLELLQRIRKGRFVLGRLGVQSQAAPAIWTAVLSA